MRAIMLRSRYDPGSAASSRWQPSVGPVRSAPVVSALSALVAAVGMLTVATPAIADPVVEPAGLVPVEPTREVDTRIGAGGTRLAAGAERFVALPSVSDDAIAVVLNVTVVGAAAAGHLTVTDCRPGAATSAVNFRGGGATANQVTVGVARPTPDATPGVCVVASAPTDLVVDLFAHVAPGGASFFAAPARAWDTRSSGGMTADGVLEVDLTDAATGSAVAWTGTVTATDVAVPGYVTVWPCAAPMPTVSNLNLTVGTTTANQVTVTLPAADPRVCARRVGQAEIVLDSAGVWVAGDRHTELTPMSPPMRVVDSRVGDRLRRDEVRRVHGPYDGELVVNLTATRALGPGWVALFPCGAGHGGTSTLNVVAGVDVSTAATVDAGDDGVCATTSVGVDVILDVFAVQHPIGRPAPTDGGVPVTGTVVAPGFLDDPSPSNVTACVLGPLDEVDAARSTVGLGALVGDHRTDAFACEWATHMATTGRMAHSTAEQRAVVDECGITGETVAVGGDTWQWMVPAWLASTDHRAVALHPSLVRASAAYVARDDGAGPRWYGVMVLGGSC